MWVGPEAIWIVLFYILLFVGGPFYIYKRRKKATSIGYVHRAKIEVVDEAYALEKIKTFQRVLRTDRP